MHLLSRIVFLRPSAFLVIRNSSSRHFSTLQATRVISEISRLISQFSIVTQLMSAWMSTIAFLSLVETEPVPFTLYLMSMESLSSLKNFLSSILLLHLEFSLAEEIVLSRLSNELFTIVWPSRALNLAPPLWWDVAGIFFFFASNWLCQWF